MKRRIELLASLPRRHRFLSSNVSSTGYEASETASAARELLRAGLRARREAAAFGGGEADAIDSSATLSTSTPSSTSSGSSPSTKSQLAAALVVAHARSKAVPGGEERFVRVLCSDFGVDRKELGRAVEAWRASSSSPSAPSFSAAAAAAAAEERLRRASTPSYEAFWQAVAGVPGGLGTLAELRAAALSQRDKGEGERGHSDSPSPRRRAALAASLARFLGPALAAGTSLVRLDPEREIQSQAQEKDRERLSLLSLAASEAQRSLHPVRSAGDWEARLTPPRACFALLHERGFGGGVPLATVACFSGEAVARKVSEVLPRRIGEEEAEERFSSLSSPPPPSPSPSPLKTNIGGPSATLYALCSAHAGLSGLDVGRAAARGAAEALARGGGGGGGGEGGGEGGRGRGSNLPPATKIATLSPLPGFLPWLRAAARGGGSSGTGSGARKLEFRRGEAEAIREAAAAGGGGGRRGSGGDSLLSLLLSTLDADDGASPFPSDLLRPVLLRLAARFITLETVRKLPLDPVARFHAANGAALARLCWRADDGGDDSSESSSSSSSSGPASPSRRTRRISSESAGIMVNYSYLWPPGVEEPLRLGPSGGVLRVSEGVARLLEGGGGGESGGGTEEEPERWGLVD